MVSEQCVQYLLGAACNPAQLLGWHLTLEQRSATGLVLHATHSGQQALLFEYQYRQEANTLTLTEWLQDCNYTLCARVSRSTALGLL